MVALIAAVAIAYARMSICRRRRATTPTFSARPSASIVDLRRRRSPTRALNINMMSRLAQQVIIVLIPPLALIFLVLGTIFLGIATPTEGGAMGAVGALIMAAAKGRLSPRRDPAGAGVDDAAVVLRAVHPDRRARLLAHLLRRQRPCLGRASAGRRCPAARSAS